MRSYGSGCGHDIVVTGWKDEGRELNGSGKVTWVLGFWWESEHCWLNGRKALSSGGAWEFKVRSPGIPTLFLEFGKVGTGS